jgi:hypothetical protein
MFITSSQISELVHPIVGYRSGRLEVLPRARFHPGFLGQPCSDRLRVVSRGELELLARAVITVKKTPPR